MIRKYLFLLTFCFLAIGVESQVTSTSAQLLFKKGNYIEAKAEYEKLLEINNRDFSSNYYYGLTLYHLKINDSEAINRLKFTYKKPPVNDIDYYLAKLYQRTYENELAIEHFQKYIAKNKLNDEQKVEIERSIEDCESSLNLINKHFKIEVLTKDTIEIKDLLSYYKPSKDVGTLLKAGDFFRIGVNEESIIYRTERGSDVFFPIQNSNGKYDLYKIVKLLDSWTDAEKLNGEINSDYNDLYPFILIDGVTLYFSSDRPGGMGGLDIYQSFFDPESGEYSEPANLGPPFNSPDDDFLLVPDVYENKAWFTTNRGITDDKVVVTEIVWDESVIRSFTDDINQIRTMATLPISRNGRVGKSTTLFASQDNNDDENANKFEFVINDTLVYTKYDDFKDLEALSLFQKGKKVEYEKDSLNYLMRKKRQQYAKSYDQQELQQLIDDIIKLEKRTYSLDDVINDFYYNSKVKEISTINKLLSQGAYFSSGKKKKASSPKSKTEDILTNLNKGDLTFYTDEAFIVRNEKVVPMYDRFFTTAQKNELARLDSLYVWANIASLESANILEKTNKPSDERANLKDMIFNPNELEEQENQRMQNLIYQSRNYKKDALELYNYALDEKFKIYYETANKAENSANNDELKNILKQSHSIFQESDKNLKEINSYNPEKEERLLAMKKMSVDMLENSLINILNKKQVSKTTDTNKNISSQQPQKAVEQTNKTVQQPTTQQSNSQKPVFKVQIGVFQNEPNSIALSKIPKTSYDVIKDKNLKKYYSGNWNNYEEAQANVESIRAAGFNGAFVVAFFHGEQISIEKAKQMK